MDSEAFENHCYRNDGASVPTSDDYPEFRDHAHDHKWSKWDPATGKVETADGQPLDTEPFTPPAGN